MTVTAHGPLFDGRALREAKRLEAGTVDDVAQAVFEEVHDTLDANLKHPTGYYESRIRVDTTRTTAVVDDSGVVYGPWLEGVSSRNRSTRFKGYAAFRRSAQRVQKRVPQITRQTVRTSVARMNK